MLHTTLAHNGHRWIAIDKVDEEAINFLRRDFRFHNLDLEDVRGESQHPKLDIYKHYFFLIIQFPEIDPASKRIRANELDIFVEKNNIVTVPNREVPYLPALLARLQKNPNLREEWFRHGTDFFCYRLLKGLFIESCKPFFDTYAIRLNEIDRQLLGPEAKRTLLELINIRRDVLDLKRIIDPQRYMTQELSKIKTDFVTEEMGPYFDDLRDLLDRYWSLINNYK